MRYIKTSMISRTYKARKKCLTFDHSTQVDSPSSPLSLPLEKPNDYGQLASQSWYSRARGFWIRRDRKPNRFQHLRWFGTGNLTRWSAIGFDHLVNEFAKGFNELSRQMEIIGKESFKKVLQWFQLLRSKPQWFQVLTAGSRSGILHHVSKTSAVLQGERKNANENRAPRKNRVISAIDKGFAIG